MMEFTKDQELAIDTRGKNIIVSAAAGSGKTSVLVERILRLVIDDKEDIRSFIIVTFTNKAAIEMKDRIRSGLEKKLRESKEDFKFIRDQIKGLRSAHIQTLHSFCADMLRENFYFFDDLSPNFKVINDRTTTILKTRAMDFVFDRAYEKMDDSFKKFLHSFGSSKNDKGAREVILKTYTKSRGQIDPMGWLEDATTKGLNLDLFKKSLSLELSQIEAMSLNNVNIAKDNQMSDKLLGIVNEDYDIVRGLISDYNKDWDDFIKKIIKVTFPRIGKLKSDDKAVYERIKADRDAYKDRIKTIGKIIKNSDSQTLAKFSDLEKELLAEIRLLVTNFDLIYTRLKEEKSYMDFDDLEHKFIDLLKIDEAREKLRGKFNHIFFDEYQDSNEIQNFIIESLKSSNNLFFVGDVKQSIYGFRRAEPKLFLEKLDSYQEDDNSTRIDLNQNFRSEKDILDFDNFIFDNLMTKESSDIDYKDGGHRLNFTKNNPTSYKKVNVRVLDKKIREEDYLVELIEEIRSLGFAYKDIAILLRSGAKSYIYEEAFKKAGLPFFNDISKVSFRAVEVEFFINMLKYLVNPKDDLVLLSVIRSEVFGFSEDDISAIKLSGKFTSFEEAFSAYDRADDLGERIGDFKSNFRNLSYLLTINNLYDFGNLLFESSGLYEFLLGRDRSSERIGNVNAFIETMGEYDKTNDNGLYGFLSYIETLSLNQSDNILEARDLSASEDLVRIMTIHKSKGLEFPVVILADSAKQFNRKHLMESVVFDDDIGLGINISDYSNKVRFASLSKNIISEKITIENKKEEMRILYVAMTRPETMLFITGNKSMATAQKLRARTDFLNMSSYLDWILAILSGEKMADQIYEGAYSSKLSEIARLDFVDEVKEIDKYEKEDLRDFLEDKKVNPSLYNEIENLYDREYPFDEDTRSLLKRSVTEISKDFDHRSSGFEPFDDRTYKEKSDFRKPNFLEEEKTYKAVEVGSIIHRAFEVLDLKTYDEDSLELALEESVRKGLMDKAYLKVLDYDLLLGFFNSDILQEALVSSVDIRKEESFLMVYGDSYINGQIDLMIEKEDDIILIDFKTDRVKREGLYDKQLKLYKSAIEKSQAKNVSHCFIYWYNFNEFEEIN